MTFIEIFKFPSCLKMANVTPVYKKENRSDKDNYRPVSILPKLSKMCERCLCKQISTFFEDILSKYQCGFRKEQCSTLLTSTNREVETEYGSWNSFWGVINRSIKSLRLPSTLFFY